MILQVCVKNSVHRHPPPPPGRLGRHPPPPGDGHCSGRYACYWNAFLFSIMNNKGHKFVL